MNAVLRIYTTALWTGFFPVAPGTAGSLLAVALYGWVPALPLGSDGTLGWPVIAFLLALTLLGVPASRRGEREFGDDGGPIVIDEVVGQWITLAGLVPTPAVLVLGFLLFRLFDVFKPFPAGKFAARKNVPSPLPKRTDTELAASFAVTRSRNPSSSRSALSME